MRIRRPHMTRSQKVGAAVLMLLTLTVLGVMYTHPVPERETEQWRRDSIRHHRDSVRQYWDSVFAYRDSVGEVWRLYYDSVFHRRDSLRQYWDSIHALPVERRDSLYRDSLRTYPRPTKRDTIVELNSADTTSLMLLYGIGHYTAIRILRYRAELGGYYDPRQILEIPELQDSVLRMRLDSSLTHLTACEDSIRPMPINRTSLKKLIRHPYLNADQAQAIYDLRRRRIRLHSMDDIRQLKILSDSTIGKLEHYITFD